MALPRFFLSPPQGGEEGARGGRDSRRTLNASGHCTPASPRCPRLLGKGGGHSPEVTSRQRKPNRFTLSNWTAHASKAVQCDVVCICERRIMFDSEGKSSQ